jgi:hypothetical protein
MSTVESSALLITRSDGDWLKNRGKMLVIWPRGTWNDEEDEDKKSWARRIDREMLKLLRSAHVTTSKLSNWQTCLIQCYLCCDPCPIICYLWLPTFATNSMWHMFSRSKSWWNFKTSSELVRVWKQTGHCKFLQEKCLVSVRLGRFKVVNSLL